MTASQYKEVLKELKAIKDMQLAQENRLANIEQWKIAEDAYRAALKQVRGDEKQRKKDKQDDEVSKAWLKVLKEIYPILLTIGAILYFYASSHGIGQ